MSTSTLQHPGSPLVLAAAPMATGELWLPDMRPVPDVEPTAAQAGMLAAIIEQQCDDAARGDGLPPDSVLLAGIVVRSAFDKRMTVTGQDGTRRPPAADYESLVPVDNAALYRGVLVGTVAGADIVGKVIPLEPGRLVIGSSGMMSYVLTGTLNGMPVEQFTHGDREVDVRRAAASGASVLALYGGIMLANGDGSGIIGMNGFSPDKASRRMPNLIKVREQLRQRQADAAVKAHLQQTVDDTVFPGTNPLLSPFALRS